MIKAMRVFRLMCLLAISATGLSELALASGGSYGGGYERETQERDYSRNVVDERFELGKAIVTGRHADYRKVKFCFLNDAKTKGVKIKRKSIKGYKRQPVNNLVQSLYRCDDISKSIQTELAKDDLINAVYYLNKRYKLQLQ